MYHHSRPRLGCCYALEVLVVDLVLGCGGELVGLLLRGLGDVLDRWLGSGDGGGVHVRLGPCFLLGQSQPLVMVMVIWIFFCW